jgi:hypothetical protein
MLLECTVHRVLYASAAKRRWSAGRWGEGLISVRCAVQKSEGSLTHLLHAAANDIGGGGQGRCCLRSQIRWQHDTKGWE